ncbi:MAG: PQQ-binding-like beta-propeller repeat protein [Acidobacteriota bacterium]
MAAAGLAGEIQKPAARKAGPRRGPAAGGKTVIEVTRQIDLTEPQEVTLTGALIEPGTPSPLSRAALPAEPGCPRRYCTAELNSRLPASLPGGDWRIKWQASLNPALPPAAIIAGADRVVTQGAGLWQLFDAAGKELAQGRLGFGEVVLDPRHRLFYALHRSNMLTAHQMSDGAAAFRTSPAYGDIFRRPFLGRAGNRLLLVGVERQIPAMPPRPPTRSLVEFIEFSEPPKVHANGLLFSVTRRGRLDLGTAKLIAAMRGETFLLAVPGRIYLADISLNVQRAFDAEFEPLLMSLDESGRIYLVVSIGEEQKALWVLSPEGKRLGAFALKPEHQALVAPPIVGYDHRIYLLTRALVVALDAEGKLLWERPAGGAAAGAGVTVDDRLLVSAGEEIAVFDANGERRMLYRFRGQPLLTPPVLTAAGEILVASAQRLYCLAR